MNVLGDLRPCMLICAAEGPPGLPDLEGATIEAAALAAGATALGREPVDEWFEHRNDIGAFYKYVQSGLIFNAIDVAAGWTNVAHVYEAVLDSLKVNVPELIVASPHASHSYPQGTSLYFIVGAKPPR